MQIPNFKFEFSIHALSGVKEAAVRFRILFALCLSASLLAADTDAIKLDLRKFTFKVPNEQADLFGFDDGESRLYFYTSGRAEGAVKLPADGDYEITVRASGDPALNERAKFKLALDGELVGAETLLADDDPKDYTLTAKAKAGEHKLGIEFTNDVYKQNEYDRNLFVYAVTVKKK
jgi:predicted xylan-binding protein with Ca-dependent carbohydrate-binding module